MGNRASIGTPGSPRPMPIVDDVDEDPGEPDVIARLIGKGSALAALSPVLRAGKQHSKQSISGAM